MCRTLPVSDAVVASKWCRAVGLCGRSQVAVAGDRLRDADQAFLRRGHGHTYEAGPLGHDISLG